MTVTINRYSADNKDAWDTFIATARNGHFMFYRDYMDYHADRFIDHSLMFYDDKKRLLALLPANTQNDRLYSHQGLTFGGLVITDKTVTEKVYDIFSALVEFLSRETIFKSIIYKRMPDIYNTYLAQEDLYLLFLLDAKLLRRDVSAAVEMIAPLSFQEMRERKVKKAKKFGLDFSEQTNFEGYWELLEKVLQAQHNTKPVHTLGEIQRLHSKFPNNIKCYTACLDREILAGTVVYETESVAHTQYLASSVKGREVGALDFVINNLIRNVYKEKKYFDFGISTEEEGRILNRGLIAQKEGFGARAVMHDFYEIKIT